MNSLRVIKMLLLAAAALMRSARFQLTADSQAEWVKCRCVQLINISFYVLDTNTADAADCAREIFVDQLLAETECLEIFGALIRLQSRNTHF